MGIFPPFLGSLFSFGALGVIGLFVFTFFAMAAGVTAGFIAYFVSGRNLEMLKGWWILTTGVLIVWGLISFINAISP